MKHDYLVKPVYIQERKGDYSLLEKIKNFEWIDEDADGCGNICSVLKVNRKTHRPSFGRKTFITSISFFSFSRSSFRPAFSYTSQDSFRCFIIFLSSEIMSLSLISF